MSLGDGLEGDGNLNDVKFSFSGLVKALLILGGIIILLPLLPILFCIVLIGISGGL